MPIVKLVSLSFLQDEESVEFGRVIIGILAELVYDVGINVPLVIVSGKIHLFAELCFSLSFAGSWFSCDSNFLALDIEFRSRLAGVGKSD